MQPYTDKTLEKLPKEGVKKILVISPGFASDCVETLEEISIQGKESFYKSGGKNFDVVPCLNDSDDHINLLEKLTIDKVCKWEKGKLIAWHRKLAHTSDNFIQDNITRKIALVLFLNEKV